MLLTPIWKTFFSAFLITKLVKCQWFLNNKGGFLLVSNLSNSLYLNATGSVHCKLNSARALLSQSFLPAPQCAVHTSTITPHFFSISLLILESPFAWSSYLKQSVKRKKSIVIIFLISRTLNNLSPYLYLHSLYFLPQLPSQHHFFFHCPKLKQNYLDLEFLIVDL